MESTCSSTIPGTNSEFSPWKMDGWNTIGFLLGRLGLFSGANLLLVSGRGKTFLKTKMDTQKDDLFERRHI